MLEDFEAAPITEKLKATLRFLKKVTLEPAAIGSDDASALERAGVSRAAAHDAAMVAFCFNLITRLADSFGWAVPEQSAFDASAEFLLKFGYRLPFRGKPGG